jgi:type IV pilus assembly protein PilN
MIRINLMPRAEARRQAARQRDKQIAVLVAAGLAAVILIAEFITRREAGQVDAIAEEHETELAELNKKHNESILLEKKRAQLQAKLATIDILERQRHGPVHVLDDLSSATPDKLWLTEMKESGGSLTLTGRGLDNQTIAQFMRKLSASPYFENVDLVETKQIEEGAAKLKQFTINARVNYAGRPMPTATPAAGGAPPPAAAPAPDANPAAGTPLEGAVAAEGAARRAARAEEARSAVQDGQAKDLAAGGAAGGKAP